MLWFSETPALAAANQFFFGSSFLGGGCVPPAAALSRSSASLRSCSSRVRRFSGAFGSGLLGATGAVGFGAGVVATFGGSWTFIGVFVAGMVIWMVANGEAARPFDPFPFILLNLVLSCLAAIQAPVIMMSQNRQEERDRMRAENDYLVNLKAELEIRMLMLKVDSLLHHQWQRLLDIQEVQTELLEEMRRGVIGRRE
mgnify:CR=1 FL=1